MDYIFKLISSAYQIINNKRESSRENDRGLGVAASMMAEAYHFGG